MAVDLGGFACIHACTLVCKLAAIVIDDYYCNNVVVVVNVMRWL